MSTISLAEIEEKRAKNAALILVEALPPEQYARGHLPGALNLPLDGFVERAQRLLPDLGAEIVVYCSGPTCGNSHAAKSKLDALGYSRVRVFTGGKSEWVSAGKALEESGHGTR